jgi:hypothetical protein
MAKAYNAGEYAYAALSTLLRGLMYVGTMYVVLWYSGIVCTCTLDLTLCFLWTLVKGTLHMYPPGKVPTHPFRVLGLVALGNTEGECVVCKYHRHTAW